MARRDRSGEQASDGAGAALAAAGGAALAAATVAVLLGLAEVAPVLHALALNGGPFF